jgi:hypothetical protein
VLISATFGCREGRPMNRLEDEIASWVPRSAGCGSRDTN